MSSLPRLGEIQAARPRVASTRANLRGLKKKAAFICDGADFLPDRHAVVDWVFGAGRRGKIEALTDCHPVVVTSEQIAAVAAQLEQVEVVFSTWGMPCLTSGQLEMLPKLRAVFFAGGSVRSIARPLLERKVVLASAWVANAVPVAEFTVGQILLSNKGYFRNTREYRDSDAYASSYCGRGNFEETVALLGAGQIGRKVIEMLQAFHLRVLVFDPFLSEAEAGTLGVEKVSLAEAFEHGMIVSNHLADVPATVGLLNGVLFQRMRDGATFINTGRGATVVEADLIRVMQMRPDLTALLDVTDPEPPIAGSLLYTLPNIRLSAHIAGSKGHEVVRMADYMIDEFKRWELGKQLQYQVTLSMLERMA